MTDYEFYKEKYRLQLKEMSQFPMWIRPQICDNLHISNHTLDKLCNLSLINKFKLKGGKSYYYSVKNDTFTNEAIYKSIMFIDFYYDIYLRYHEYERENLFSFDDVIDNKSLISRNVKKIGFDSRFGYYYCSFLKELKLPSISEYSKLDIFRKETLLKEYSKKEEIKKLTKLLIDIQSYEIKESSVIYVSVRNLENFEFLKDVLEYNPELFQLVNSKYIYYKFVNVEYPQLDEIKL